LTAALLCAYLPCLAAGKTCQAAQQE